MALQAYIPSASFYQSELDRLSESSEYQQYRQMLAIDESIISVDLDVAAGLKTAKKDFETLAGQMRDLLLEQMKSSREYQDLVRFEVQTRLIHLEKCKRSPMHVGTAWIYKSVRWIVIGRSTERCEMQRLRADGSLGKSTEWFPLDGHCTQVDPSDPQIRKLVAKMTLKAFE